MTTTATTTSSRPTPAPKKEINKENAVVKANFAVKFNKTFQKDLENPETEVYKTTATEYKEKLKPLYENVTNFKDVNITKFWKGSIGVDYMVIIIALADQTQSNDNETALFDVISIAEELRQVKGGLMQLEDADSTFISSTYDSSVEEAAKTLEMVQADPCQMPDLCEPDYRCEAENDGQEISCVYKCSNLTCPRHGECFIDEYHEAKCRCIETDKYVYSGEDCSVSTEKLALSSTEILAIGLSVGLAVIVIVIVISVFVTYKRMKRHRKVKSSDDSDISTFGSEIVTMRRPDMIEMRPVKKGRDGDMFYTGGMEQKVSSPPRKPSSRISQIDIGYYNDLMRKRPNSQPLERPSSMISSRSLPELRQSMDMDNTAPRDSWHGMNWGHTPALAFNPRASWSFWSAQQSVADDDERLDQVRLRYNDPSRGNPNRPISMPELAHGNSDVTGRRFAAHSDILERRLPMPDYNTSTPQMYLPRPNEAHLYRPTSRMMSRKSRDEVERRTSAMYDKRGGYGGGPYNVWSDDMMPDQSPVQPRPQAYQERQRLYRPARASRALPSAPLMSRGDMRGYMPSVDEGSAWMDNAGEQGQTQLPRLFWEESAF